MEAGGDTGGATGRGAGEAIRALVTVMPREGVLDPQGEAIARALQSMGFDGVREARQGKVIALALDPDLGETEVRRMCEALLANSVIEDFRIEMGTP